MAVRFHNPSTLPTPPGYSYVVDSQAPARIIYFAGQLGVDMNNNMVGSDFRSQCHAAFENMTKALAAAGASWEDVVKINNYLVDIEANMPTFREVRDTFLNRAAPPASTTVGVPALARAGGVFEVEVVAVIPAKAAAAKSAAKGKSRSTAKKKRR